MGLDLHHLSCPPDSTSNWLDTARNLGDADVLTVLPSPRRMKGASPFGELQSSLLPWGDVYQLVRAIEAIAKSVCPTLQTLELSC